MTVSKRITAKVIRGESKKPQQVSKVLSLLPSDYRGLVNLPTVNGVEVSGDLTSKDLSILSSQVDNYDELDLGEGNNEGKYFVLVGDNETTAKVPAQTIAKTLSILKTTEELDKDMDVGSYRFVEKKRGN